MTELNKSEKVNQETQEVMLIPVSKWNNYHSYPTVKALRQIIFNKKKNDFTRVLRKIGGRLYIIENEFYKWVEDTGKM